MADLSSSEPTRFHRSCCLLSLSLALGTFISLMFVRSDSVTYCDDKGKHCWIDTIEINHWFPIHHWTAFLTALVLLLTALVSFRFKRFPYQLAFFLMPMVVYPTCFAMAFARNLAPWVVHGGVEDTDGRSYFFLESSLLQGQTLALARVEDAGLFATRYKVLATTNGDSPRSYLLIVRPAGMPDEYGQIYLTPGRLLAGVRYDNKLFLAYDLDSQQAIGHGEVELLSPFLCLGKETVPNQVDAQSVVAGGIGEKVGQARRLRVAEALSHENAWVRAFAEKLLQLP